MCKQRRAKEPRWAETEDHTFVLEITRSDWQTARLFWAPHERAVLVHERALLEIWNRCWESKRRPEPRRRRRQSDLRRERRLRRLRWNAATVVTTSTRSGWSSPEREGGGEPPPDLIWRPRSFHCCRRRQEVEERERESCCKDPNFRINLNFLFLLFYLIIYIILARQWRNTRNWGDARNFS